MNSYLQGAVLLTSDAYFIQSGRIGSAPPHSAADLFNAVPNRMRVILSRSFAAAACAILMVGASALHAQAKPTAVRAGDLQAGGGFVLAAPDYGQNNFKGYMGYATFDFKSHYGAEFNIHQINAPSPSKLYERTYELGGRYVRHYGIYHPYAKLLYGRGVFNYEYNVANLAYNIGSIGLGVDVNAWRHLNVRADYEYQNWFNFRGFVAQGYVTSNSASLSPQLFTIGAAYHFF